MSGWLKFLIVGYAGLLLCVDSNLIVVIAWVLLLLSLPRMMRSIR